MVTVEIKLTLQEILEIGKEKSALELAKALKGKISQRDSEEEGGKGTRKKLDAYSSK